MSEPSVIDGLVLCLAGDFRFAFAARSVRGIEAWSEQVTTQTPCVREMFQLSRQPGRVVRDEAHALVVDSLEVSGEPTPCFPVPDLLARVLGGALAGFVLHQKQLQPLLHFAPFAAYVQASRGAT